jgi:natural product biosynthesis luciferase-like monooxygenase protein
VKFSIFCLGAKRDWISQASAYSQILEQAQVADDLGFKGIWLAEHHFTNYGTIAHPAILLTALAERTQRLRLGTGIVVSPFHDPRRLAEDYAMVDVLSGGRLDFGVGRGYQPEEFEAFGVSMEESRSRFKESMEILQGLWTGEAFSYTGNHWSVDDLTLFPKPLQQPIPVWMACVSPDSFEIAARSGFRFISAPGGTPWPTIRANMDHYFEVQASTDFAVNSAERTIQRQMFCGEDAESSRAIPHEPSMWFRRLNGQRMSSDTAQADEFRFYKKAQQYALTADFNETITSGASLYGTPDEIIATLREMDAAVGLEHVLLWIDMPGIEQHQVVASLERFAREVMPAFAEPTPDMPGDRQVARHA